MPTVVSRKGPETADNGSLGKWLRAMRKRRKLTVATTARLAGIKSVYVEQLEGGKRSNPSLAVVVGLAKALNVRPADVLRAWIRGR